MVYMPGILQYLSNRSESLADRDDGSPETASLWLPSDVKSQLQDTVCVEEVIGMEERLREASCLDALHAMRHTLCVKSRMVLFKNANVQGQRDSGHSRELVNCIHDQAKEAANCYHRNRAALLVLRGSGNWEEILQVL